MRSLTAAARELRAGAEDLALRQSEGDSDAPASEKLSAAGEELRTLSAQKARLLAQRDALGDRQALTERRAALRAAHDADERTFAALSAALTELTAADEELADQGIAQSTIRLSIGTEHIDDILADLDKGFAALD